MFACSISLRLKPNSIAAFTKLIEDETLPLLRKSFFNASAMAARLCVKNDSVTSRCPPISSAAPLSYDEA
jgi:hypothetical protein